MTNQALLAAYIILQTTVGSSLPASEAQPASIIVRRNEPGILATSARLETSGSAPRAPGAMESTGPR